MMLAKDPLKSWIERAGTYISREIQWRIQAGAQGAPPLAKMIIQLERVPHFSELQCARYRLAALSAPHESLLS